MSDQTARLLELIHEDARAVGHIPLPWVNTVPEAYISVCKRCGSEATVVAGECENDEMQYPCEAA